MVPGALIGQMGGQAHRGPGQAGGYHRSKRIAPGPHELSHVGVQRIVLEIGTHIHRPGVVQDIGLGQGQIGALLPVMQVVGQRHGILLRMGVVVRVVVGVLETEGGGIAVAPVLVPGALEEEVLVGLALGAEGKTLRPADDRTGKSALAPVAVQMRPPLAPRGMTKQLRFQAQAAQVAVFPYQRGVETGVFVSAVAGGKFGRCAKGNPAQPLVPTDGRVHCAEGSGAEFQPQAVLPRRRRSQVHGRSGGVFLGSLQAQRLVPVVQRNGLQIIGGKPAQVHLHVLGVVHLDVVQEDAHVLTAQAAHIHSLKAAGASVVLYLDAGETTEDIGHLGRGRYQAGEGYFLGRPGNGIHLGGIYLCGYKRVCFLGQDSPGSKQQSQSEYEAPQMH